MKEINSILAGFGGQGILFMGKFIATAGLIEDKQVSWLPSYGPEMRGGTANCSVCISDDDICSPLVTKPNVLIVMNLPSLTKFIDTVETGGTVIVDSTLVSQKVERDDINVCYVPATELAEKNGLKGLANIILIGKLLNLTHFCEDKTIERTIEKIVPERKKHLIPKNLEAIKIGVEY